MISQNIIYLKALPDGTVAAFGDRDSLMAPVKVGGGAGICHQTVTVEEWEAAGCEAYAEEDGRIVLGRREEAVLQEQTDRIRLERDRRLRACDKMSPMRWNAMSEAQRADWTAYRQALLDVPQRPGFPWGGDIAKAPWPAKPE